MFKQCNKCGFVWKTRNDFIADDAIKATGYQVFFEDLKLGLFLFNHACNTTIAVEAQSFLDLYDGPISLERKPDGRQCPGRCTNENFLSPCSDECKCAFISKLLAILGERKAADSSITSYGSDRTRQ